MPDRPEDRLQTAGYIFLKRWIPKPGKVWSVEHAGKRSRIAGARLKARGCLPGVHDTHTFRLGDFRTIEWKIGSNKPTEDQVQFGEDIIANGGHWRACWSVAEAEEYFRPIWNLPPAAALHAAELDAKLAGRLVARKQRKTRARNPEFSEAQIRRQNAVRTRVLF